jgi:hypothetical protein
MLIVCAGIGLVYGWGAFFIALGVGLVAYILVIAIIFGAAIYVFGKWGRSYKRGLFPRPAYQPY